MGNGNQQLDRCGDKMSIYIIYYNYQEAFVTTIDDEHLMLDKYFNTTTDREKQDFTRVVKDTESIRCYIYSDKVDDLGFFNSYLATG